MIFVASGIQNTFQLCLKNNYWKYSIIYHRSIEKNTNHSMTLSSIQCEKLNLCETYTILCGIGYCDYARVCDMMSINFFDRSACDYSIPYKHTLHHHCMMIANSNHILWIWKHNPPLTPSQIHGYLCPQKHSSFERTPATMVPCRGRG